MHYKVGSALIKTENCAKPCKQASSWVLAWIRELPRTAIGLDFGCGKLRYTIPLARRLRTVFAVDSSHQIGRRQVINGRRTTVEAYAEKSLANVQVCPIESKRWRRKFDVILCINVLSTMPLLTVRRRVLRSLAQRLKSQGQLFICVQFRNSHFEGWRNNPRARKYKDGWLVENARGTSFYAIIPPRSLVKLCKKANLNVVKDGSRGESAFVIARGR